MNKPLISILIPCYNVEPYINKCVNSILSQTYSNLQLVIIDDGSSDKTWNEIQTLQHTDKSIEIYSQPNQGVAATRNNLLSKVKGEYVLFVDSDDWIEKDMVEFLVSKALSNDADVVTCGIIQNNLIHSETYSEKILNKEEAIKLFLLHKELTGSLCNKLVKTSLLHNLKFDDEISYGEDALFCWNFLQKVNKLVFTTKGLYHYRMNETSISHQSFGEKKLTGYKVWHTITEQTEKLFPQFLGIAKGRWAMEGIYLLMQANQSHYKCCNKISMVQRCIKENIKYASKYKLGKKKHLLLGKILSRWYKFGRVYFYFQSLR